jgi:hypothetical protein
VVIDLEVNKFNNQELAAIKSVFTLSKTDSWPIKTSFWPIRQSEAATFLRNVSCTVHGQDELGCYANTIPQSVCD